MSRISAWFGAIGVLMATLGAVPAQGQIANTRHNLSVSASGTNVTSAEPQICIFCHAPHNATPETPLWNRRSPGLNYQPYTSSTAKARAGQPTGASLMCLSCHDGTVALGDVLSRTSRIVTTPVTMPAGNSHLGTDLRDDHPISISYATAAAADPELAPAVTLTGRVKLDASGQMQCTACHDAHDNTYGKFLVMSNQASALCVSCHTRNNWSQSSHATATKTWNGVAPNPWTHTSGTTVAANACENCHRPHTAGGAARLLNYASEEANCLSCHNSNVAAKNIQSEFNKLSIHPIASTTGVHDPVESAVVGTRHVECVDCHNPHASNTVAGTLDGSLKGVRGVDINGSPINPSNAEYQICFRCHGDSTGVPAPNTPRVFVQTNTRLQFQSGNPSHHAVAGPGRSTTTGLLKGLTTASTIKCSDCHNNDSGPAAAPTPGTGPNGPHGSKYASMLAGTYLTTGEANSNTYRRSDYELCYKCHDENKIINPSTERFGRSDGHQKHVKDKGYRCNTCHDPHGISSTQVSVGANGGGLVNFNTTYVKGIGAALPRIDTTTRKCYLSCHGQSHNPESY